MKKGYWIVAYRSVNDASALQQYGKLAESVIANFEGEFLVRTGEAVQAFEAGVKQRTVVVQFASFEKALAAYESAAYKNALNALGDAAIRDFRIAEGTT